MTSYTLVANSADAAESRQLSFVLEGRQFDGDDKAPWTLVDEQKEIFWPYSLYRHMFVVPQNQIGVYNQYRFREVKTYNDLVNYTNELELYSHSFQYTYPELTYNKEVVEVYYHAYLPELYPLSFSYYHDFVITPSLPRGLSTDSTTGRVTGIPEEFTTNSNFIIQAKNPLGKVVQTQLTINFSYCSNNHNLVKVGFHIPYETQAYSISADLNEGLDGSGKNVISFRSIQSVYKEYDFLVTVTCLVISIVSTPLLWMFSTSIVFLKGTMHFPLCQPPPQSWPSRVAMKYPIALIQILYQPP